MRIVLATDGSDDGRAAGAWLAHFPLPIGSRLLVVSAVSIPPSALDLPTVRDFIASLREEARRTAGDARDGILRVAEEWPADLVVLGARGLGALAGFLLGSVSLGIARHAHCSVLVVKPGAGAARGIVVGIDGSESAAAAASFVASLPLEPTTVVRLTSVIHLPPVPTIAPRFAKGVVRAAFADIAKERTAALQQAIAQAAAPFKGVVETVERRVLVDRPTDGLLSEAAKSNSGLIVVGARGLGTVSRLLLGSVSESVLRHADRPVLIVKSRTR
jgi:nucleotide-binding universal stress UspA family protein